MIKRSHRGFHFHFHFHPSSKNCTHPGPLLCTLKIYLFTQKNFSWANIFLILVVWYKTVSATSSNWVSDRPLTTTFVCVYLPNFPKTSPSTEREVTTTPTTTVHSNNSGTCYSSTKHSTRFQHPKNRTTQTTTTTTRILLICRCCQTLIKSWHANERWNFTATFSITKNICD